MPRRGPRAVAARHPAVLMIVVTFYRDVKHQSPSIPNVLSMMVGTYIYIYIYICYLYRFVHFCFSFYDRYGDILIQHNSTVVEGCYPRVNVYIDVKNPWGNPRKMILTKMVDFPYMWNICIYQSIWGYIIEKWFCIWGKHQSIWVYIYIFVDI